MVNLQNSSSFFTGLSFAVTLVSCYVAICACERLRGIYLKNTSPSILPFLLSLVLILCSFGVGIFSSHFIHFVSDERFNGFTQFDNLSHLMIIGCFITLTIVGSIFLASKDRVFAKTKCEILEFYRRDYSLLPVRDHSRETHHNQYVSTLLTIDLSSILYGMLIFTVGLWMLDCYEIVSLSSRGQIDWNLSYLFVALSFGMIFFSFAFWILFRLLSIHPDLESLRILTAVCFAVGVTGMNLFSRAAVINFVPYPTTDAPQPVYHSLYAIVANPTAPVPSSSSVSSLPRDDGSLTLSPLSLLLLTSMAILWIVVTILFGDMHWKLEHYRQFILKTAPRELVSEVITPFSESSSTFPPSILKGEPGQGIGKKEGKGLYGSFGSLGSFGSFSFLPTPVSSSPVLVAGGSKKSAGSSSVGSPGVVVSSPSSSQDTIIV